MAMGSKMFKMILITSFSFPQ